MIISFACKETEKIWQGVRSRNLPSDIQERALRKLHQLDVSDNLEDLRVLPANHPNHQTAIAYLSKAKARRSPCFTITNIKIVEIKAIFILKSLDYAVFAL